MAVLSHVLRIETVCACGYDLIVRLRDVDYERRYDRYRINATCGGCGAKHEGSLRLEQVRAEE